MTESQPAAPPLRVLVVDSDERLRDSLAALLCIGGRCAVVGSAGDAGEALSLVASSAPDVVILDPRLFEADGSRAFIGRLRELQPGLRILAMGRSDAAERDAVAAGADAFIHKTFRARELVDAVLAAGRRSGS